MKWYVGTSGWSYAPWRKRFYPPAMPQREWLAYYARHFNAVEINNTFYRIPGAAQIAKWESMVPDDFTFAIKASRKITHDARLRQPREIIAEIMQPLAVRRHPGPLLFQLPPRFPKDLVLLEGFLQSLPADQRCAVEFRDPDWHDDAVYHLLRRARVAFCLFEKAAARSPRLVTAPFTYVRLHGRESGYRGNYDDTALRDWHQWLAGQERDAYVFFDNTAQETYALDNARAFHELTQTAGEADDLFIRNARC